MSNWIDEIEQQEQIQILVENGYGGLIDKLRSNQNTVFTKKGRLNKSGACRELKWKTKQLEEAMMDCRRILEEI